MTQIDEAQTGGGGSTDKPRSQPRVLQSEELLRGEKEVLIAHHGETYRLRETRNGKLILGK
ncbi:MAG: hemin uptake protein HemP [Planctomycetia bacterium]|nr:hemin uptake protein HemP [Planctomycetia bacterium]